MLILLLFIITMFIPLEDKTTTFFNLGGGLNFTTVLLVLIIAAWFLRKNRNEPLFARNPINFPVTTFILFIYLSIWTGYFKLGTQLFGPELHFFKRFITAFILFYIIVNNVKDRKTMRLLLHVMIMMIVAIALANIREFISSGRWHYDDSMRAHIAGMQPNVLGAFFAQSAPIILSLVLINSKLWKRGLYLILFFISLSGLMFTYSRGAYLAIIGAVLAMGIFSKKRYLLGIIMILCFALFVNGFLFGKGRILPVSVTERFQSITMDEYEQDKSIKGREEIWAVAGEYIARSPIVGYGYGASRVLLPIDTHSMYLDIALESGIPSLLVLFWLFWRAFLLAIRTFRASSDPLHKAICLGLIGSIAAVFIGNFFGTRLNYFASNGYFAILLGMTARIHADLVRERQKEPGKVRVKMTKKVKLATA